MIAIPPLPTMHKDEPLTDTVVSASGAVWIIVLLMGLERVHQHAAGGDGTVRPSRIWCVVMLLGHVFTRDVTVSTSTRIERKVAMSGRDPGNRRDLEAARSRSLGGGAGRRCSVWTKRVLL